MRRLYRVPGILFLALPVVLCPPLIAQGTELTRGAMLAVSCAGCHGPDGRSPGAIPAIAGKSADYIEQAMKDFRSGKRESTVMGRHARGYSDAEIKLIAGYFANK